MFTVAIIGPDGAGKSSVIEGLQRSSPYPIRRVYMGVNPDSLSHMLPTTRLVNYLKRRRHKKGSASPEKTSGDLQKKNGQGLKRNPVLGAVKSFFFIANRFGEAWYRQAVSWYYLRQGYIVLFDRHFYLDHLAYDFAHSNEKRPFLRRAYDRMLEKNYPRPDLTIYLDAPAEVLFARKHESTIENLDRMREAYLRMKNFTPAFCVVDTTQPLASVLENVSCHIQAYRESLKKK
jgi:thymidylate kinase